MSTPSPDDVELLLRDLADGRGTLGDVFEKHAARTAQCIQELTAQVAALQAEKAALQQLALDRAQEAADIEAENEALQGDPAEQRAERYALEARDLTLRLIATEQDRDAAVALLRDMAYSAAYDSSASSATQLHRVNAEIWLAAFDVRQGTEPKD